MNYSDQPAPHELTYRITRPDGLRIGLHFPPGMEATGLAREVRTTMRHACKLGGNKLAVADGDVIEILAHRTLDHIDRLEQLLNDCRNALIDYAPCDDSRTFALIDQAADALGHPRSQPENDDAAPTA
jgi:hypothetical protein